MDKETVERVDLKPCPFCGSTNVFLARLPVGIVSPNVACRNCGARGPGKRPSPEAEQHAIEAWNTRADTIPIVDMKDLK